MIEEDVPKVPQAPVWRCPAGKPTEECCLRPWSCPLEWQEIPDREPEAPESLEPGG